jgi:IS30 family transposase
LAKKWSPKQISKRLRQDFPDDDTMRVSHEATLLCVVKRYSKIEFVG